MCMGLHTLFAVTVGGPAAELHVRTPAQGPRAVFLEGGRPPRGKLRHPAGRRILGGGRRRQEATRHARAAANRGRAELEFSRN